jgi:hypothetical protein
MNEDQINKRLKAAINSVEVPPFLEAKIRRQIQDQAAAPRRRRWTGFAVASVAAALVIGVGVTYQLGHIRQTSGNQESFIATISTKVATLMRVGLGDHLHCAFFRKFPAEAPAVEEMESKLGLEYKDLIPVVRQNVPQEYKLVLGHQCRYNGRQFVHLSLKNDSQLISLVITAKRPGESFDIEGILPGVVQSGVRVYDSNTGQFQIAAMETSNHLVYFISDLPAKQNMQLMQSMVASLKMVLENSKA